MSHNASKPAMKAMIGFLNKSFMLKTVDLLKW